MSNFGSKDFLLEVSKGNVPGHSIVTISATNPALTGSSDVWDLAVPLVPATGVETLELVTSGVDTIAGTGAQKVTTVYLDSSYNEQTTVTDTNAGTTAISTTNFFIHQRSFVSQLGTDPSNQNDITVRVTSAGAIRGRILAPTDAALPSNATRASHYTVPLGKTAIGLRFYADAKKGDDSDVDIYITNGDDGIFIPVFPVSVYQSNNAVTFSGTRQFTEKTSIKAVATAAAGPVKSSILLQLILIDNDKVTP